VGLEALQNNDSTSDDDAVADDTAEQQQQQQHSRSRNTTLSHSRTASFVHTLNFSGQVGRTEKTYSVMTWCARHHHQQQQQQQQPEDSAASENVIRLTARTCARWHRAMLIHSAGPVLPSVQPSALSSTTNNENDDFLSFRQPH